MNRLRFEHIYFCRNCENEFEGSPFGFRLVSHLPLCRRCTLMGEKEGVANRVVSEPQKGSKIIIYFFIAVAALVAVVFSKTVDR